MDEQTKKSFENEEILSSLFIFNLDTVRKACFMLSDPSFILDKNSLSLI